MWSNSVICFGSSTAYRVRSLGNPESVADNYSQIVLNNWLSNPAVQAMQKTNVYTCNCLWSCMVGKITDMHADICTSKYCYVTVTPR